MNSDLQEYEQRQREALEADLTRARERKAAAEQASLETKDKDGVYIWGGVIVATLMLTASMGLYAFPNLLADSATVSQQEAILRLESCRQVFQSIAVDMSQGQAPAADRLCPDQSIPNVVSRDGSTIRVAHPIPGQFGLAEFYVTNKSNRVFLVGPGGEELSNWDETTRFYAN